MADTIRQDEEMPEEYPDVPSGLSAAAQALGLDLVWQRIENYVACRWTARDVTWIVEGSGEWVPPLKPATVATVEIWQSDTWQAVTLSPSALGGYELPGHGPYRFKGAAQGRRSGWCHRGIPTPGRIHGWQAGQTRCPLGKHRCRLHPPLAHPLAIVDGRGNSEQWRRRFAAAVQEGMMGILDLFRRKPETETRSAASGFTAEIMSARESYISGRRGVAELTGTAQSCISLWEGALAIADVDGTDLITRHTLAMAARSLALRGEAVFLIRENGLVPCADWDLRTRDGRPTAYRISISEAGGGTTQTALAAEVLHVRIGADPVAPWSGTSPLRRASLTAGMLQAVESALAEVFDNAPLGSQIVPYPESPDTDLETLGRGFRGRRGRVLMRESVHVSAAGGPAPQTDWRPADVSPDLQKSMTAESLAAARESVCGVFGVLPALFHPATTGPLVREAQRHLCQWTLQPIGELLAEEASEKLGTAVKIDTLRPTQAFDAGGAAWAFSTLIEGLAKAKEAGLDQAAVLAAFQRLDWTE